MSASKRLGLSVQQDKSITASDSQMQTMDAFSYKWNKTEDYESEAVKRDSRSWLLSRYCAGSVETLDALFAGEGKIILDAGCGSGYSAALFFGDRLNRHDYLGIDISEAVDVGRRRFAAMGLSGEFLRRDIRAFQCPEAAVDIIFSEGVLHHTDSTRESILHLSRFLRPGGKFLFYVYARKAALRELADDHIREYIRDLSNEEAYAALLPLTRLGKALGDLHARITIPEDIPCLDIRQGTYDLQRFFYYNICKAYYREDYTLEEMNLINFDWYRPLNCHRHTPDEIREYCRDAGLGIERMVVEEAGISVVAVKAGEGAAGKGSRP